MIIAMTGKDTIKLNGRLLNDLADGDCVMLTVPNDLMGIKTGKNGNSLYAYNYTGLQSEVKLRIVTGGGDDKFINGLLASMNNNPPAFVLITGEFIKNVGDGQGNITPVTYTMSGGVFKKQPEMKENVEGDVTNAVIEYTLAFSNNQRTIG